MTELRPEAEAFGRWWDALNGGDAADPRGVDPTLAATLRRLQALDREINPDRRAVAQLRAELLEGALVAPEPGWTPRVGANGSVSARSTRVIAPAPPKRPARPMRLLTQFATAALLLVTLAGVYVSFVQPSRPGGSGPADVPGSEAPGLNDDIEVLARVGVAADDVRSPFYVNIGRAYVKPGAHAIIWSPGWAAVGYAGTEVSVLLNGSLRLRSDGPIRVMRVAPGAAPEDHPAGTEVQLDLGDAVVIASHLRREWINDGEARVDLVSAWVEHSVGTAPWGAGDGYVSLERYAGQLITETMMPAGPLTLTLGRRPVTPEEPLPWTELRDGRIEATVLDAPGPGTPTLDRTGRTVYVLIVEPATMRGAE